ILARICGRSDRPIPDDWLRTVVEAGQAEALAAAADRTMVAGLLWAVLTPPQRDLLAEDVAERLRDLYLGNALRWEVTRKLLCSAAASLGKAGIPMAPLKGAAVLLNAWEDPGQRAITDLDLLVPEETLETAQDLLSRGAAHVDQPRAEHHHLGAIIMPGAGGMIELHGSASHAELWPQRGEMLADGRPITVDGASFIMPDRVDLWLHTACHGIGHAPNYWPRMAADLALLHGSADWCGEQWEAVWRAAQEGEASGTVLVAAAIANLGRIPAELLALTSDGIDAAAVEKRAREAWTIAATARTFKFGPWSTSWVTGNERRRTRFRQYLLPPSARLSEKLPVSRTAARVLYPCGVLFRCFELAKTGVAWRLALRGRSLAQRAFGS
ncbi:MAG: nucleotidyltransferase family protein, partial [Armatimonadota bacterium]